MNQIDQQHTQIEAIILVFDIHGSSIIIEDLARADNLYVLREMFTRLNDWLQTEKEKHNFKICNFTGDGWIFLFPTITSGDYLQQFMIGLTNKYHSIMRDFVIGRMECRPEIIGMSFGAASGQIVEFEMSGRTEYFGRPINIACRLQAEAANSKLCVSSSLYLEKFATVISMSAKKKEHILHNIAGESRYQCFLVSVLRPRPDVGRAIVVNTGLTGEQTLGTDRIITLKQKSKIVDVLLKNRGSVSITFVRGDGTAEQYAEEIRDIFNTAYWHTSIEGAYFAGFDRGLMVSAEKMSDRINVIITAFDAGDISIKPWTNPHIKEEEIKLQVGNP